MTKITIVAVFSCLSLLFSINLFAQTETFDIVTYTPPKDFIKDTKQGVVTYSHVNKTSGGYCIINLYASSKSTGDEKKDFKNEWNELVVTPFKADPNPNTETSEAEGWKAVVGASMVKIGEAEVYIILTVFSGYGKTFSVMTSLNEESYTTKVDALFATMELDKTANPSVSNTTTTAVQTSGATGKFGAMMYTTPAGWSEDQYPDGVVFKPTDLPAGELLFMQIMQPINSSGTLEQVLSQSYNEAAVMYKSSKMHAAGGAEYDVTQAKKSFKGWEYIRGSGGVKIENGTPYADEYGLDLFIIKVNNRFERIAILKSRKRCTTGQERYYPTERPHYYNALDKFFFSIHFTDYEVPDVKPGSIKGEGLVGIWEGISMSAGAPSTSDPLGLRYKVFNPIFLTNGQAYFGSKFPIEGLDGLNTWIRAEKFRRDWGTYTFSNGRGVLKVPYGDLPIRAEGNKIIITVNNTEHAFHKLNSVDGARFNGTYIMKEQYGKIPVITFTADGRFTDNGAVKALHHEADYCINPALMPGSGTYEVRNHSVIFSFSDGRKVNVAFLGTDYDMKNQSPVSFTMGYNEDELRRQ